MLFFFVFLCIYVSMYFVFYGIISQYLSIMLCMVTGVMHGRGFQNGCHAWSGVMHVGRVSCMVTGVMHVVHGNGCQQYPTRVYSKCCDLSNLPWL